MHLGQTATFLAKVLGMEERTMQMVARLMRENSYVTKGARGVNAPHLTDLEIARFLIAVMVAESPALSVERLPHFAALPLSESSVNGAARHTDQIGKITFEVALAGLLETIRNGDWDQGNAKDWYVEINVAQSAAAIATREFYFDDDNPAGPPSESHIFDQFPGDQMPEAGSRILPHFAGLERSARLPFPTLYRIARGSQTEADVLSAIGVTEATPDSGVPIEGTK